MNLHQLETVVIHALEDIKGQNIVIYDTTLLSSAFDRVILVDGTSNRQTRSLATHVASQAKLAGAQVIGIEGLDTGEWVLVDLGDLVVHIMQPAIRQYYNLEELWGGRVALAQQYVTTPKFPSAKNDSSKLSLYN